jgi:hypothetical protein
MDLNIQNLTNSFKKDLRFFAQINGSSMILYPSRCDYQGRSFYTVFYGDSFSKFPRNSSEQYQQGVTVINFSTGLISGSDEVSVDFTPITPAVGQAVVGIISIDKEDRLYIRNNSYKTIEAATWDFENGNFPNQKGKVPLYGFLIKNVSGSSILSRISDIKPDLGNIPFDTADIVYTNTDNFVVGSVFREYLADNALSGSSQIKIKSTKLKRGDSISVQSSATSPQVRTVISVSYDSTSDTITLDQNLNSSVALTNNAFVTLNTFSDLSQVFNSSAGKILYDSNWRGCTTGFSETLTHNLTLPLGTYIPYLYFNTTQTMVNAKILTSYAWGTSFSNKIGAQLKITSTTANVRFATTAIVNLISSTGTNTGTVTSGFYRLILLGN